MIEVRDAAPEHHAAYVRLHAELGVDDPVPGQPRFVDELMARTIVALDRGEVVGYALAEVLADTGYVRNLASDPARRRIGIGVALMAALRQRFLAAGATTWCLNVKPDNAAAIALYERFGLARAYRSCALRVPASAPLEAPDGTLTDVAPDEDPEIERRFGLLRGQLASARARPSRRVVKLVRGGELAGVGVFAASVPGAFPFRLVEPALAAAFLAHLRALAPDAAYVQVGVEDDDALRAAVLALGGYVQLEILHMRGAL